MLQKIIGTLGGSEATGFEIKTELDMVDAIRKGFRTSVVEEIIKAGLSKKEVGFLIIKRSTLAYRKSHSQSLSPEESEHALRIARILAFAEETFANPEKAVSWLRKPNRSLMNKKPLDLLDTEEGARIIETTLGQISHGLFN
jgi:putative toxin-antitoxin system antitoxin component (TIGR02293 family)